MQVFLFRSCCPYTLSNKALLWYSAVLRISTEKNEQSSWHASSKAWIFQFLFWRKLFLVQLWSLSLTLAVFSRQQQWVSLLRNILSSRRLVALQIYQQWPTHGEGPHIFSIPLNMDKSFVSYLAHLSPCVNPVQHKQRRAEYLHGSSLWNQFVYRVNAAELC